MRPACHEGRHGTDDSVHLGAVNTRARSTGDNRYTVFQYKRGQAPRPFTVENGFQGFRGSRPDRISTQKASLLRIWCLCLVTHFGKHILDRTRGRLRAASRRKYVYYCTVRRSRNQSQLGIPSRYRSDGFTCSRGRRQHSS